MKIAITIVFVCGCVAFLVYNVVCIVKSIKDRKSEAKKQEAECKKKNDETIRKDLKGKN